MRRSVHINSWHKKMHWQIGKFSCSSTKLCLSCSACVHKDDAVYFRCSLMQFHSPKKNNILKVLEKEQRVRRKSDLLAVWNAICLARVTGRIHDVDICHSALRCTALLISCEQIFREKHAYTNRIVAIFLNSHFVSPSFSLHFSVSVYFSFFLCLESA